MAGSQGSVDSGLSLLGATPVDTQAGTVGSPEQINSATTAPGITISAEAAPSVHNQGGVELLPKMDWAVKQVESGNQHYDKDGGVKTSPSGALGISQLMPGTAKDLGVDPADPAQNAEGGKRLLGNLYQKYGNWNDALIAYNWGEQHTDKWLAAGGDPAKLPAETQAYVPAVLGNLGMSPGAAFIQNRDAPTVESGLDLLHSGEGSLVTKPDESNVSESAVFEQEPGLVTGSDTGVVGKDASDERTSLLVGARNGLRDIVAGPAQMVLEKTSPQLATELTNYINQMDQPYQQQTSDHPAAYFLGQTLGTTAGIMGAAGLLAYGGAATAGTAVGGALESLTAASVRTLPRWAKLMGSGFALGASAFNSDPEHASRMGEGVLGAFLGPLAAGIGRSINWMIRQATDRQVVQNFTQQMLTDLKDFAPHLSNIKDSFTAQYTRMTLERNTKYGLRDATGRALEGYPTGLEQGGGIAKVIQDAMAGNIGRDQRTATPAAIAAARELERALGLDQQRAQQDEFQRQADNFAKAMSDLKIGGRTTATTNFGPMPPSLQAQIGDQLRAQGANLPVPPEPFVSTPITAEQMAEGRRVLARHQRKARSDVAARTQINILKQSLDDTASQAAKSAGVDVNTYERLQTKADQFNRDVIAPMQKIAGGLTPNEFSAKVTPASMYDAVVKVIQGHDKDAQQTFFNALGPKARQDAAQAVMYDMFQSVVPRGNLKNFDPKAFGKYLDARRTGVQVALGTPEYERLQGIAKIAENLGSQLHRDGSYSLHGDFFSHHRWLLAFAGAKFAEGEMREGLRLGMAVVGLNALGAAMRRMSLVPRAQVLLFRAARLNPEGTEMRRLMNSVDVVMNGLTKTTSRLVPQSTGGEPANTGLDILGSLGGSL